MLGSNPVDALNLGRVGSRKVSRMNGSTLFDRAVEQQQNNNSLNTLMSNRITSLPRAATLPLNLFHASLQFGGKK